MITYNALNDLVKFRHLVDDFFIENRFRNQAKSFPLVNITEKDDMVHLSVLIPGAAGEDIDLNLVDDSLVIHVNKKDDYGTDHYLRKERLFGTFKKSIQLPYRVDPAKINASLKEGILKIDLYKSEEAKPKKIAIN